MDSSTSLAILVIVLLLILMLASWLAFWKLWSLEKKQSRERERVWEVERERLLNRAMTKEWESYAQMGSMMQVSPLQSSDSDLSRGMSDEEEVRRAGLALEAELGMGGEEVLVELHDEARSIFQAE